MSNVVASVRAAVTSWWFEPLPKSRIARFRSIVYVFIFVDVLLTTSWVVKHAHVPGELYQPLFLGRLLPLPTPGPVFVYAVEIALLVTAAIAAMGKLPRLAGFAVFILYFEWMFIAMSYGKVDHDRFAFLVALAVLPTVGAARWNDEVRSEKAGWALRFIQLAVVLTYFLAAVAKIRYNSGFAWLNGATLMWAVLRRGTFIGEQLIDYPWVLRISQWGIMMFELTSPIMLLRGRIGKAFLGAAFVFHIVTYATISIIFLPHVVCLLAFLPLERVRLPRRVRSFQAAEAPSG